METLKMIFDCLSKFRKFSSLVWPLSLLLEVVTKYSPKSFISFQHRAKCELTPKQLE